MNLSASRLRVAALRLGLLVLGVAMVAAACPKVTATDAGPPSLEWTIRNTETNVTRNISGSGSIQAKPGEAFDVTLKAISSGGVKEITLGESLTWTCQSGDAVSNHSTLGKTDKQTTSPDSSGKVLTEMFLLRTVQPAVDCQPGYTFAGGGASLSGTGQNFFGKIAKGTVGINVS